MLWDSEYGFLFRIVLLFDDTLGINMMTTNHVRLANYDNFFPEIYHTDIFSNIFKCTLLSSVHLHNIRIIERSYQMQKKDLKQFCSYIHK